MKHTLLIAATACALLTPPSDIHAAPMTPTRQAARIHAMGQDENTRIMMIHELMSTKEGKQEMARELAHDDEFRSHYETHALNPG